MEKLKVFIVEDELPAQKLLEKWIQSIPELLLIGIYSDGFSALKAIQLESPDLLFLDFEMPKLNGLEILELLEEPPQVIFTTAYQEFAVKAFELSAIDYLLKPFSLERFKQAVDKALSTRKSDETNLKTELPKLQSLQNKQHNLDRIVVKEKENVHVIPVSEIFYFEAQGDYVMIHTKEHKYLKLMSLRSLNEGLSPQQFVRVHRSFIVNVSEISKIGNYTKDSYQIILSDGKRIKVSRSGLALLREILYL